MLAPTEVLAEQHYANIRNLLAGSNVQIDLFTGRSKRADKTRLTKSLVEGKTHIAIGTQALIQSDIDFANLGLVVIDEQHKLGVEQRSMLKSKAYAPHYLVMTATPIPRTLALSYFADFDVTTIDHLPARPAADQNEAADVQPRRRRVRLRPPAGRGGPAGVRGRAADRGRR
jgi:ATP-dependent DNA helicase RecG